MNHTLQEIVQWAFPLVSITLLVMVVTRRRLSGKPWLVAHLVVLTVTMLAWRIANLVGHSEALNVDMSKFYELFALPLHVLELAGFCLLFPFLVAVADSATQRVSGEGPGVQQNVAELGDTENPLYGVHGWLKFFVVVKMYVVPVVFGLQLILGAVGFAVLAEEFPGIVVVGLIELAVGIFVVIKWIMIARRLRDLVPGVVQEAKKWLVITLAWSVLSTPLAFMAGMDPEAVALGAIKQVLTGVLGFAIWFTYFKVSKRVKATYPDWDK